MPSWLTCPNCLSVTNSEDVESQRVTHSAHTTLPFSPALLQIACQRRRVRALMYLYVAVGFECRGNWALLVVSDTCPFNC